MLFNTWTYWVFLPLVFAVHWTVPARHRPLVLLGASFTFYGFWDVRFLLLMGLSILVDYQCALALSGAGSRRRAWLALSVATNLGILGVFKYFDFFAESLAVVLTRVGLDGLAVDPTLLGLVLPVGISFYTFQSMAYTIDVYRGKVSAEPNLLRFALYVSFFPQLVAGPIERAGSLLPQLRGTARLRDIPWAEASELLLWGMFKKTVIADNLAPIVSRLLDDGSVSGPELTIGLFAFAFQILCDFSGYTDIARGSALLFGVRLRLNFRLPYLSVSPSEFWRRWHISLSTWLRDYLYISLGGNRRGSTRTHFNLMVTMLLGGLWHGAAWNFVLWGAFHGALLVVYRMLQPFAPRRTAWTTAPGVVLFFLLTLLGWGLFRAQAPGQLATFAKAFTQWSTSDWAVHADAMRHVLFLIFPLLLVMVVQKTWETAPDSLPARATRRCTESILLRTAAATFLLGTMLALGATGGTEFIYFQF